MCASSSLKAKPASVKETITARSSSAERSRARKPLASSLRISGEVVPESSFKCPATSLTDKERRDHNKTKTKYCGYVNPHGFRRAT